MLGSTAVLDVTALTGHAEPAVRDLYLPRVASGQLTMCNAMTEPYAPGSEPGLTTTRAVQESDGSRTVHGRKWFVTVPPGHLPGEAGRGLRVIAERVRLGRLLRCLRWLGQAERAFTLMRERARSRPASSGRLADLQLVQALVFDALLAIRTIRPLVFEAVALVEAGLDARVETGLAKVAAARMLHQVTDAAIQVHGAAGLGPDTPLPALFRTGRMARLLDGPDELHITAVARRILG
ncbi:acyl-CoA dehydrogenase family protein [Streptosporangium sp. LJ11]|uniref:acyl-CoA dehydrogenase family protein n=1 Tax=Streptosporangium sp. LJ11 TaxID=3436927 RepID=UPI003F7979CA